MADRYQTKSKSAKKKKKSATNITKNSPKEKKKLEDNYIKPTARCSIHEEMFKDQIRTISYRDAIYLNKHLFKGKTVLDVGCGTGILSLLVAKAGAAKVIAIDCSNIVDYAEQVVVDNNLQDVIKVVKGRIEDVGLPDGIEKVDIIVSDWMGYCLFYESMWETVIFARDKWLIANGIMFPARASLHLTAIKSRQFNKEKFDYQHDVYGLNMKCFRNVILAGPSLDFVEPTQIVSSVCLLKQVDLYTVKKDDLTFSSTFCLTIRGTNFVQALATHFDIEFTTSDMFFGFSTPPDSDNTHWRQTVFPLDKSLLVKCDEEIHGIFNMKPRENNHRVLDFVIDIKFRGELSEVNESCIYLRR